MQEKTCFPFPGIDGVRVCCHAEPPLSVSRIEYHGRGITEPTGDTCDSCNAIMKQGELSPAFASLVGRIYNFLKGNLDGDFRDILTPDLIQSLYPGVFKQDVMRTLMGTRMGETISYGALAAKAGHPGSARAVGTAMRTNPLPILVPCHRVVAGNGLGGYAGEKEGVLMDIKRRLIELEQSAPARCDEKIMADAVSITQDTVRRLQDSIPEGRSS
jgi:O-6-methylguanine DNA methyltransferase